MSSLILKHPEDEINLTKEFIDLDNWRVIGIMSDNTFYLITSCCHVYHIKHLTLEKFHATIQAGFDLPVIGTLKTIALICPHCTGTGVTDWVSDVTGVKRIPHNFVAKFNRNSTLPLLRADLYSNTNKFTAYFSRALIPEAHQHCKKCDGTGLFGYTLAKDDDLGRVFKTENHI